MSSIDEYERLKHIGTSRDRLKFILSLKNKNEIEKYLKEHLSLSYCDLQTFIFLSKSTKNEKNLYEIFQNGNLPTKQRCFAIKCWFKLKKNVQIIHDFVIQSINDKNLPRYIKHHILKFLHKMSCLKKSSSFFKDIIIKLTETFNPNEYNINAHLIPFCNKDQILKIFSQWSFKSLEQFNLKSTFFTKLIHYQPVIIIELIKQDLIEKKLKNENISKYFIENENLFNALSKKVPKELICLVIEHFKMLENHKRILPSFIQANQEYFFKKVPNEMIELITMISIHKKGTIFYESRWFHQGYELDTFLFPRSFSIENYRSLFMNLYDKCQWSLNNINEIFKYFLKYSSKTKSLFLLKKEQQWLIHEIIEKYIGKENFLKKLIKEGNENLLELFDFYREITTPLSKHLLLKAERKEIVPDQTRLSLLRYQLMTNEIFDEFLCLFKKTSSDIDKRQINYCYFFECALYTNEFFIQNVLQWIEKKFTNEQINVIEGFLTKISSSYMKFHLNILPNNINSIETIINIAINHLQMSTSTLQIIINYAIFLLKSIEFYQNKQNKEIIQQFSIKILKKCYSKNESLTINISSIELLYRETRKIFGNILLNDVFPRLISKCMFSDLNHFLNNFKNDIDDLPEIDLFLNNFFSNILQSSIKIQSSFHINRLSELISLYLKNKSTRLERANYLINNIDRIFFIDKNIQRIILIENSNQYQQFINNLIQDNKSVSFDELSNEQSKLSIILDNQIKNMKIPGFYIDLLMSHYPYLTGQQQIYITNIILNDYLQDKDISNHDKLKSLHVLRCLTNSYSDTIQWIKNKYENSTLERKISNENKSKQNRGADVQSLDDILLCLPATFDLNQINLVEYFHLLNNNINSSNSRYIKNAMRSILHKIPDEIFLNIYLDFINSEQFQKFGITVNKEILRLLIEFESNKSLIKNIFEPLWNNHPHQDIRACLISILLYFFEKSISNDDQLIILNIFKQAAYDEYIPVIQQLFISSKEKSYSPLLNLKYSYQSLYEIFVNQIQFQILDHPTSLEIRSLAWSHIDYEFCNIEKLIEKIQDLVTSFNKEGYTLWEKAFEKIIFAYKKQKISSINLILNIIEKIILCRDNIDSKQNALDDKHDLPVYHRIQRLLTNIDSYLNDFDKDKKMEFFSFIKIFLQFDKTLAPLIGKVLIKICQNKEQLEEGLKILQDNLTENYFEKILIDLSNVIIERNSCCFIQQLNLEEKLQLSQWFIQEKNRPVLVFNLLKNDIFDQYFIHKQTYINILQQLRLSENLYLKEQSMTYIVPWNEENDHDEPMDSSH